MIPHDNAITQKRLFLSLLLTATILAAEVVGGLWTGSLALLSDAAHVFMDIFALGLSFLAMRLSALPADDRHTYGYHRLEVLAALANGLSLGGIAIGIFIEAYRRFLSPEPVKSLEMLLIAAVGLAVNLVVVGVLSGRTDSHAHDGHQHADHAGSDLNVRSAFLHVVGDAISSVGVILGALIISATGWLWIDPVVSVLIGVLIVVSSYRVLRSSLHILIEGTPEGLSLKNVVQVMAEVPGILDVHDLHVWNICSGRVALSAHVVVCEDARQDAQVTLQDIKQRLASGFGIQHTTVQFETAAATCEQGPSACRCH